MRMWVPLGWGPTLCSAISDASSSLVAPGRPCDAEPVDDLALPADDDHVARMLHRMGGPVPRVERVGAVVRVRLAVKLPEPRIFREPQLVLGLDLGRLRRVGPDLVVEVDVAR